MQWLSVGAALAALGFSIILFRSRRGASGYGNVLVVMPLALTTPLFALLFSGLLLIDGFRRVGEEGRHALVTAIASAARTQLVGHVAMLAVGAALTLVLIALWLRPRPAAAATEPTPESKLGARWAVPSLAVATLVCIAGVAALTELEDRLVTAPLAFVVAFDSNDFELSSTRRTVEDQRRRISNTVVVETFRTLVVIVLFLVLFDAFFVGSRGIRFSKGALVVSAVLLALSAAVSARGWYRQLELQQRVHEGLRLVEVSEPEPGEADGEGVDEGETPEAPDETPGGEG